MTRTPEPDMGALHFFEVSSQTNIEWMEPSIPLESPTKNLPDKRPSKVGTEPRTIQPTIPNEKYLNFILKLFQTIFKIVNISTL